MVPHRRFRLRMMAINCPIHHGLGGAVTFQAMNTAIKHPEHRDPTDDGGGDRLFTASEAVELFDH